MGEMQSELNRLVGTTGKDAQGAANTYAGTSGRDLVGALNEKAGNARGAYRELQGVLNQLAGTTGLGVNGAATSISGTSFAPDDIAGLDLWLQETELSALADGAAISSWNDKSSANHDAAQATGANQPIKKDAIINSRAVARFDGVDDNLRATVTAGAAKTMFVVMQKRSAPVAAARNAFSFNNGDLGWYTQSGASATRLSYWNRDAGFLLPEGSGVTNPNIYVFRFTSATEMEARTNGGAATTVTSNFHNTQTILDLGQTAANGDWDFGEFIVYTSSLALADMDDVGEYLASRWGLTWTTAT